MSLCGLTRLDGGACPFVNERALAQRFVAIEPSTVGQFVAGCELVWRDVLGEIGVDRTPLPVLGIGTTEQDPLSTAAFVEYERNFRGSMLGYHLAEDDIDCMVDHALSDPSPDAQGELSWTAEELNAFASDCDVDFSKLYYMTD